MAEAIPRYYWDSCAWIGFINEEADKITPLRHIWDNGLNGNCEILTSVYAYIEVTHGKEIIGPLFADVRNEGEEKNTEPKP